MSIVRVGLSENRKFAEGWEAIFGGKKKSGKSASRNSSNASARKTKKATAKKSKK